MKKQLNLCVKINAAVIIFLAFYIFLISAVLIILVLAQVVPFRINQKYISKRQAEFNAKNK